jgi:hypothetical protein
MPGQPPAGLTASSHARPPARTHARTHVQVVTSVSAGSVVVNFAVVPTLHGSPLPAADLRTAFAREVAIPSLSALPLGMPAAIDGYQALGPISVQPKPGGALELVLSETCMRSAQAIMQPLPGQLLFFGCVEHETTPSVHDARPPPALRPPARPRRKQLCPTTGMAHTPPCHPPCCVWVCARACLD